MIRRPPRSTHCISSAASDVYKRQETTSSRPVRATPTTATASGFAPTSATECTVLRVPCIPSSQLCGFWRSSVRSVGPPSLNLGRGRRPPTALRRSPPFGCARLETPAAPRLGRAARCAPECAHALTAEPHEPLAEASAAAPPWVGVSPGGATRSVQDVDVIATNQTSEAQDE